MDVRRSAGGVDVSVQRGVSEQDCTHSNTAKVTAADTRHQTHPFRIKTQETKGYTSVLWKKTRADIRVHSHHHHHHWSALTTFLPCHHAFTRCVSTHKPPLACSTYLDREPRLLCAILLDLTLLLVGGRRSRSDGLCVIFSHHRTAGTVCRLHAEMTVA